MYVGLKQTKKVLKKFLVSHWSCDTLAFIKCLLFWFVCKKGVEKFESACTQKFFFINLEF